MEKWGQEKWGQVLYLDTKLKGVIEKFYGKTSPY